MTILIIVDIFLLIFCSPVLPDAANKHEQLEYNEDVYGYWIGSWSIESKKKGISRNQYIHSVYHFAENDSLYIYEDEELRYKHNLNFYKLGDTIIYNSGSEKLQESELQEKVRMGFGICRMMINGDTMKLVSGRSKNWSVFVRSNSNTIPIEKYGEYLTGRKYKMPGPNVCFMGVSYSNHYEYLFTSDTTFSMEHIEFVDTTTYRKPKGDFTYELRKDTIEFMSDREKTILTDIRVIKQRIGVTKNELLIPFMEEIE